MEAIGRLMAKVARGEDPYRVGKGAVELGSAFRQVYYCFDSLFPPSR